MTQSHLPPAMSIASSRPCRPWCPRLAGVLIGLLMLTGSHAQERSMPAARVTAAADAGAAARKSKELLVWMTVGERRFAVTLAETDAARAFAVRLPLTLEMSDLNDNEKKFDLPTALPANANRPGTIRNGDLMLYGAHTVVLFYLTFDSPYSYTRLGRVDDPNGLAQALGKGSVKVEFSRQ